MPQFFRNQVTDLFEAAEGGNSNVVGSLAYIQLEKQNARLKEALIRYGSFCKCRSILISRLGQSP